LIPRVVEQSAPQPLRWYPLVSQSGAHSACKRHFRGIVIMDKLISELLIPPERVRKGDFGELLVSVLPWRKKNRHQ